MNCKNCQNELEDVVLNPAVEPRAEVKAHLAACKDCSTELSELRKTFALLDDWTAPKPSAWFDTRLAARMRSEEATAPVGFFERMKARFLYNTGAQFRPLMAGAMALVLLLGGAGTYVSHLQTPAAPHAAVVEDLQIIDRNDQAIQDMDLLDDNVAADGDSNPTT